MTFQPFELSSDGTMGIGVEFIKGQNIIVYNLKTKKVKYITNHTWDGVKGYCWTYHPVLSPGGKEIVYYSSCVYNEGTGENSLIVTTLKGTSRVLAGDEKDWYIPNAWLPDGKNIVFLSLRHGSWALWGVDFKNGKVADEPFLIRDGMKNSRLLNWTRNGLACWNWVNIFDIFQMEVDPITGEPVGKPMQLEYTPTGYNVSPVWSPDGKSLAFLSINVSGRSSSIVVVGSQTREFPVPKEYGRQGYMRWTPDGSAIGMFTVQIRIPTQSS